MHTDVAQEIFDVVSTLPEEKQRQILRQAEAMLVSGKAMTIWDKIHERSARIPKNEWERMPTDGSEQHDHYVHGTSKK